MSLTPYDSINSLTNGADYMSSRRIQNYNSIVSMDTGRKPGSIGPAHQSNMPMTSASHMISSQQFHTSSAAEFHSQY